MGGEGRRDSVLVNYGFECERWGGWASGQREEAAGKHVDGAFFLGIGRSRAG